ncbi:hypothetical protein [Paraburkholderia youngii]|uniref:hypothetical protein n=1 Tax=Paraburkholderia youngii TaxID=2782701 RepID=UPI003D207A94
MRLTPEEFPVVMDAELRSLWHEYHDDNVRRLILEVHRARQIMREAHEGALAAQLALWNREDGNLRASIQKLVDAMLAEKIRLGVIGGRPASR